MDAVKGNHMGPGKYDYKTEVLNHKESFNYGKVPFGSNLIRPAIGGRAWGYKMSPGPGQYELDTQTTAFCLKKGQGMESAIFKSRSPKIS